MMILYVIDKMPLGLAYQQILVLITKAEDLSPIAYVMQNLTVKFYHLALKYIVW